MQKCNLDGARSGTDGQRNFRWRIRRQNCYLHAIDRPTQIYFARAVAAGRAAERIAAKPELVEMERMYRKRAGRRPLVLPVVLEV